VVVAVLSDEGVSGKAIDNRPGLENTLGLIRSGVAGTLMVAKLDRLSRRMEDLVTLVGSSAREGWALTSCDGVLDTSTPEGRLMGHVMGSFAEFERELARSRTVAALAIKKAQGVRLGAPIKIPGEVRARIARERAAGRTYQAIGDALVRDGIPNSRGDLVWFPAAVRSVALSVALDEAAMAAARVHA
jgi:DNA invertase Pin-like site-specific DNA recombinase